MQNMARVAQTCDGIEPNYVTLSRPPEAKSVTCEAKVACISFEKMSQKALNRVLRLDCSGAGDLLQSPLKFMDLQNKNISVVTKHWKYRISVPMSYISCLETKRRGYVKAN